MLLNHVLDARCPLLADSTVPTPATSSSSSPVLTKAANNDLDGACQATPSQFSPRSVASDLSTCASPLANNVEEVRAKQSSSARQLLKDFQALDVPEQPAIRAVFWVVLPAFAAYAALFALQHEVKAVYGIADDGSAESYDFSKATSLLYVFSLAFRFLHNVVFGFLQSRSRVYMAIAILMTSMSLLIMVTSGILVPHFSFLVAAYSLGGIGIGTFESNLLSSLTGLGDSTKKYATVAIPVGVCLVQVGGFFLLQLGLPVYCIYAMVILGLLCAALTLRFIVPVPIAVGIAPTAGAASTDAIERRRSFAHSNLYDWQEWLPCMWTLPLVMAVDLFYLSLFSPGVMLFIYDGSKVALLSPPAVRHEVAMPTDMFFVFYNLCLAAGGCTGRWTAYSFKKVIHPAWYTILPATGACLVILGAPGQCLGAIGPALAPIAAVLITLGDGLMYCTISRTIDERVPRAYNLAAVSCWFFVGDWGSVIGSNLIPYIRDWVSA